MLLFVLSFA